MSSVNTKAKNEQNFSVGPSERFLKRVIPSVRTKTIKYIREKSLKNKTTKRELTIKYKADNANVIPTLKKTKSRVSTKNTKPKKEKVLKVLNRTRRITKFQPVEPDKFKLKGKVKNISDLDNNFYESSEDKNKTTVKIDHKKITPIKEVVENVKESGNVVYSSQANIKPKIFSNRIKSQNDNTIVSTVISDNKKYSLIITVLSVSLIFLISFFLSLLTSSTEVFQDGKIQNKLVISLN